MHEYSLMQNVIALVTDKVRGQNLQPGERVSAVAMKVGALEMHSLEAFRQAFTMLADSTVLKDAELRLTVDPGRVNCPGCGFEGLVGAGDVDCHDAAPAQPCPRCGQVLPVMGGRGVSDIEIEIECESPPQGNDVS